MRVGEKYDRLYMVIVHDIIDIDAQDETEGKDDDSTIDIRME